MEMGAPAVAKSWIGNPSLNGWGVVISDVSVAEPGEIATSVAGANVVSMVGTFAHCASLTVAPTIPSTVTNMNYAFYNCSSLTTIQNLPASVVGVSNAFESCTALTGSIEVDILSLDMGHTNCFAWTSQSIALTGSASDEIKAALAATSSNGNVTY